jgi:hypothetical protein
VLRHAARLDAHIVNYAHDLAILCRDTGRGGHERYAGDDGVG